jgi:hypothetical protein
MSEDEAGTVDEVVDAEQSDATESELAETAITVNI